MPKRRKRRHEGAAGRPLLTVAVRAAAVFVLVSCGGDGDRLTIRGASGGSSTFFVEIADTAAERERGLMFRQSLASDQGMLFLFPEETRSSFWMKNTPISLDLIFIRDGQVVDVIENAEPYSEALLTPSAPYLQVLEVGGGTAARKNIQAGDLVIEGPTAAGFPRLKGG